MKSVQTANMRPGTLGAHDTLQIYNGLDCCLTVEILEEIKLSSQSPYASRLTYNFERAMQGPALEMMLRGWKVDRFSRDMAIIKLKADRDRLQKLLDSLVTILWDGGTSGLTPRSKLPGLNPRSPKQMKEFFYGRLGLPEQHAYTKGQRSVTTNREALENLDNYFHARIFVRLVLALRHKSKQIGVLSSEVSSSNRMHTSYNVTGTETGRWSSSKSVFNEGTNLQNITEELRHIFVSDPGKKLAYIDLSQAESRVVGFIIWSLFGYSSYLDACESGDLHTAVCRMVWEDLGWTGDLVLDRAIADQKFYLHFSYRDMAKRGGHGTNYVGTPRTMARHLKVREPLVAHFQEAYFSQFPGIKEYHRWVRQEIGLHQYLETPLGMGRHFFGRPSDDAVIRKGVAFIPQSTVGQLLNLALWRVWHASILDQLPVQCLGQIHDAIVIQYDEELEDEVLPVVLKLMTVPLHARGRTMTIPSDAMVGWNWSKASQHNPDGLITWKNNDKRQRQVDPSEAGLDRLIP